MNSFTVDLSCASLNYDLNATCQSIDLVRAQRDEHLAMIANLETITAETSYKMMVPIGSKALMKGSMVHTNELLVNLGDNWFVKRSAVQTIELLKRRVERFDQSIDHYNEQYRLINDRLECLNITNFGEVQASGTRSEQLIDICETYDDRAEREWRDRHRTSVRNERLKELAERKQNG